MLSRCYLSTGSGSGSAAGDMVTAALTTDYDSLTGTDESYGSLSRAL